MSFKISLIVPIFNTDQKYLEQCFSSVFSQTYKNFECILINDCSDKLETIEFIKNLSNEKLKKFSLEKNVGLGMARNYGFDNSTGDIIVYLDSDDYLSPTALEDINNGFVQHPNLDFYWFDLIRVNEILNKQDIDSFSFNTGIVNINSFPNALTIQKMSWMKAYSKHFLLNNKIRFIERWIHCEDVYYNIVVLSKASQFIVSNTKNYFYRIHPNTLQTSAFNAKKAMDLLDNVIEAFEIIKNDNNFFLKIFRKCLTSFFTMKYIIILMIQINLTIVLFT